MRDGIRLDLAAAGAQLVERIGRRCLDPVNPSRQQRGGTGRDVGNRQQHHALAPGQSRLVPIVVVALQLSALAGRPRLHLPRTGAGRRLAISLPVAADLLEVGRARDREAVEQRGHDRVDTLGLQLDLVVVDLAIADQRPERGDQHAASGTVEGRRLVVQGPVDAEDHGIGVEVGAVVELHALAQFEDPFRGIGRILVPFGRQTGHQLRRCGRGRQVPCDQRVVERIAHETDAFGALVGRAVGCGDVGQRHGDAQGGGLLSP